MIHPSDIKKCAACQEYKLLSEFHTNKARHDGKQGKCKNCVREYNEQRRARLIAADPEWEAKARAANKEYQANWRSNNRERSRRYSSEYYARNRERIVLKNRNDRLAREKAARESSEG